MLESTYATALTNALARGVDGTKLVEGLIAHLKLSGRMKLLPRIKKTLEEKRARAEKNTAVLEIARESEESVARMEAEISGFAATKTKVRINDSLIRGWRIRSQGTLVDRSAKSSLIELYRHITN